MSSRRRYVVWDQVGAEVQCALWREKLETSNGSITRAAKLMGFSRRHATRLTAEHGLQGYAAELRRRAVGNALGRPRKLGL